MWPVTAAFWPLWPIFATAVCAYTHSEMRKAEASSVFFWADEEHVALDRQSIIF